MVFYPKGSNETLVDDGAMRWTGTRFETRVGGSWKVVMDNPLTMVGELIYGGGLGSTPTALPVGTATQILHGGATPNYAPIVEADLAAGLTNITTANADGSKHGLLPRLSGVASQYFNGAGNWATPSGAATSYTTQGFNAQTSVTVVHNFGTYPVVQVIDGTGAVIAPATITNTSVNSVTVTFGAPTTGTILLTIGSPQAQSVVVVNDNYLILVTDRIIQCTVAGKTMTLPTAVGYSGREFIVDNASTGPIYVTGTQTIQGVVTQNIPTDSAIAVYSNGAVWRIY